MPRARTTTTEEPTPDAPKKRAPRKRVVASGDEPAPVPRPRAPRKRAAPVARADESTEIADQTPEPVRRAPTPLRAERSATTKSRRTLLWASIIFVAISGIGAAIGLSDGGQIDVVAVVNERNERINRGEVREGESTQTVPVQNSDQRPNGGLVPADPSQIPPPPPEPATTTDSVATTTEDGAASSTADTTEAPAAPTTEDEALAEPTQS